MEKQVTQLSTIYFGTPGLSLEKIKSLTNLSEDKLKEFQVEKNFLEPSMFFKNQNKTLEQLLTITSNMGAISEACMLKYGDTKKGELDQFQEALKEYAAQKDKLTEDQMIEILEFQEETTNSINYAIKLILKCESDSKMGVFEEFSTQSMDHYQRLEEYQSQISFDVMTMQEKYQIFSENTKDKINRLTTDIDCNNKKINQISDSIFQLEKKQRELEDQATQLRNEKMVAESDLNLSENEKNNLQNHHKTQEQLLQGEISKINNQMQEQKKEIATLQNEKGVLVEARESIKEGLSEAKQNTENQILKQEKDCDQAIQDVKNNTKQNIGSYNKQISNQKKEHSQNQDLILELSSKIKNTQSEINESNSNVIEHQQQINKIEEENKAKELQQQQVSQAKQNESLISNNIEVQTNDLNKLEEKLKNAKEATYKEIKQQKDQIEKKMQQVKDEVQTSINLLSNEIKGKTEEMKEEERLKTEHFNKRNDNFKDWVGWTKDEITKSEEHGKKAALKNEEINKLKSEIKDKESQCATQIKDLEEQFSNVHTNQEVINKKNEEKKIEEKISSFNEKLTKLKEDQENAQNNTKNLVNDQQKQTNESNQKSKEDYEKMLKKSKDQTKQANQNKQEFESQHSKAQRQAEDNKEEISKKQQAIDKEKAYEKSEIKNIQQKKANVEQSVEVQSKKRIEKEFENELALTQIEIKNLDIKKQQGEENLKNQQNSLNQVNSELLSKKKQQADQLLTKCNLIDKLKNQSKLIDNKQKENVSNIQNVINKTNEEERKENELKEQNKQNDNQRKEAREQLLNKMIDLMQLQRLQIPPRFMRIFTLILSRNQLLYLRYKFLVVELTRNKEVIESLREELEGNINQGKKPSDRILKSRINLFATKVDTLDKKFKEAFETHNNNCSTLFKFLQKMMVSLVKANFDLADNDSITEIEQEEQKIQQEKEKLINDIQNSKKSSEEQTHQEQETDQNV